LAPLLSGVLFAFLRGATAFAVLRDGRAFARPARRGETPSIAQPGGSVVNSPSNGELPSGLGLGGEGDVEPHPRRRA
jgi:hypothetical protein